MKKLIVLLLGGVMLSQAQAGIYGLTHHSRANCGNNESISWHLGHTYWLWVVSRHRGSHHEDHQLVADWAYTWQQAAVHWGEGRGGWSVEGHHWIRETEGSFPYEVAQETVIDCSVYDGWWDKR